jgi:hypothetical protein
MDRSGLARQSGTKPFHAVKCRQNVPSTDDKDDTETGVEPMEDADSIRAPDATPWRNGRSRDSVRPLA